MIARDVAVAVLRSPPIVRAARLLSRRRLRILAYHGVPDASAFDAQMEHLAANYRPVGEQEVANAAVGDGELPDRAVWVTFDDGDPSVVGNGLPTLRRLEIPTTMFVCPGLIESGEPFWWRIVEHAAATAPRATAELLAARGVPQAGSHVGDPSLLSEVFKSFDDARRRELVDALRLASAGPRPDRWRQLDHDDLDRWLDAGMGLGNHSWDHPCLDRCKADDQRRQVRRAHNWLTAKLDTAPNAFAYPNGNHSAVVEDELADLGYPVALLYDNRLTSFDGGPLRLSRLMVEADDPTARLASVLSGAQWVASVIANRLSR